MGIFFVLKFYTFLIAFYAISHFEGGDDGDDEKKNETQK